MSRAGSREPKGWGRPDVFVLVEAANEKALAESVLDHIQQVDGVESTDTHILID